MSHHAASLVSSSSRSLPVRMRPDLAMRRHSYQGRNYWVLKDPVALKYYRFEDEEFAILQSLDGAASLDEVQRRFERRFAPQKISLAELNQFLGTLHRSSLVVSDVAGQGRELFRRHNERRWRNRWSTLGNVLSLRFKGFDPDRLLTYLDRRCGSAFSRPAGVCWLLCVGAALLLVATQFDVFRAKLPTFYDFFAAKNWIWLGVTLAVTKVLHEFGHGLACKHFGGECHEMGVMLLVGTPCLYCNVSDAWMLPNKWRRAWIGAAGMYVELLLAAAATFLWWFSEPGLLNYLCLNVMFVCSVSTIVFNANPLLRYDGYYILADLLEIPNLRQKATAVLHRRAGAMLLGLPLPHDPFLPQRRQAWFATFCVASFAYRWMVTFSILWFLYKVFEPYGLQVVGQLLAGLSLYGLLVQPLWQVAKFFYAPGRIEQVKKPRLILSASILAAAVVGLFVIPLPHYVRCSLYIQPRSAAAVYVDVPGSVAEIVARPGRQVRQHDPLVTLDNVDLRLSLVKLQGERAHRLAKMESLRQRSLAGDDAAGLEIAPLEQSLAAIDQQIAQRHDDLQRLTISAPITGVVFAPPSTPPEERESGRLAPWHGQPLEKRNAGAFYSSGTLVCRIGDPHRLEAMLAIDQADIDFVKPGQNVELFLTQRPGRPIRSRIEHLAADDLQTAPASLSSKHGGDLVTHTDPAGHERPLHTTYLASAEFDDPSATLLPGTTGHAKIFTGYETIATRTWRYLCRTFRFEL